MRNFKGQTCSQQLTGKDIFVGRNGAGKTTRIQALGLSMLGFVPKHGKTAADTFKLATGDDMCVGLKTESFAFNRSFTREEKSNRKTGEVSVTVSESVGVSPGRGEKNDTAKKSRITDELGDFPIMLDVNEFLGLPDNKRRAFIYGLSPIKSDFWNKEMVESHLENNLLTLTLKANNYDQFVELTQMIGKAIQQYPDGFNVQDGLQAMLDWAETERKVWDSKSKDAKGAVRQFSDIKNQMAETDRNITAMNEELEKLRADLIVREKQISGDIEKKKAIDIKVQRIEELKRLISEGSKINTDTSGIDRQITELQGQVKEVPDIDEQLAKIVKELAEIRKLTEKLRQDRSTISANIQTLEATIKALKDAINKTKELNGVCVIHKMIGCPKDFSGVTEQVKLWQQKQVDPQLVVLKEELKIADLRIKRNGEQEQSLLDQQSQLMKDAQGAIKRNNSINKSIAILQKQKQEVMAIAADHKSKMQSWRDEMDRLQKQPHEFIAPIDILQAQTVGMRTRIDELKADIDEKVKAKQAIIMVQQSMLDNRKSEYSAIAIKSILEQLGPKGIQGEIVKSILEPIRKNIGVNLKLCGFDFEPFFQTESDTGKEIFQFGWVNEKGHHVNFDALSTGQQTVYLAAMMVTIIDMAQPKTRILVMDDLNHLDRQNFQLLINGLDKLSEKLDNIILAGAIEYDFAAEGWGVWNLSEQKEGEKISA
jgi:exonuclease SbcC